MRAEEEQLRAAIRGKIESIVVQADVCAEPSSAALRGSFDRFRAEESLDWNIEIRLRDGSLVRLRTTSAKEPRHSEIITLLYSRPSMLAIVLSGGLGSGVSPEA